MVVVSHVARLEAFNMIRVYPDPLTDCSWAVNGIYLASQKSFGQQIWSNFVVIELYLPGFIFFLCKFEKKNIPNV